jgi:SOS-response transcriptional repressor LexA
VKELSEREKKVLAFCKSFMVLNGYSPSIREIMASIDIPSTSEVRYYLQKLEARGLISRVKNVSRSIVIMKEVD